MTREEIQKMWDNFLQGEWEVKRFWVQYETHYLLLRKVSINQKISSLIIHSTFGHFNSLCQKDIIFLSAIEIDNDSMKTIKDNKSYQFNFFNFEFKK